MSRSGGSSSASSSKKRKSGGDSRESKLSRLSEPLQECHQILKFFQARPDADAFLEPVDWEAYGLMDYPEIITHPMDLSTVQSKLEDGKYGSPSDFAKDMRLIWKNAMTYNRPDSDIFETAEKLAKLFEKKFGKIKSAKKSKSESASGGGGANVEAEKEATRQERLKFTSMVASLSSEQLGSLVQMIQKECPEAINDDDEEELEIEINNLDQSTLHALNTFCQSCIEQKGGAAADQVKKENGGAAAATPDKKKK